MTWLVYLICGETVHSTLYHSVIKNEAFKRTDKYFLIRIPSQTDARKTAVHCHVRVYPGETSRD